MIDPSIITNATRMQQLQQQQNMEAMNEFGGNLGKLILGRRINQMRQLPEDQRKAFAKNSIYSGYLNDTIKSDDAAAKKAVYDQLQTEADIAKTSSEAYKNNQQGAGYGLENSGKKLGAIQGAFQQSSLTGDKTQVMLGLDGLRRTGMISPEDYAHQVEIVKAMSPDEIKQYAGGINFANAKDPASLQYVDANTVANNAQSDANNIRTTQASIYGTDVAANTADKNRAQSAQQFEQNYELNAQKLYFEQNKPIGFETGNDGYRYAIYPGGKGVRVLGEDGQPIKVQPKGGAGMNATTQKAILETDDTISAGSNAIKNLKDALKYSASAYDGLGASQRALAAGTFGLDQDRATATTMLDNIVTGNALEMLKATFGGAPTEGERAILLQLQGSANLPRAQREAIYTRAITMAEARLKSNQQKAQGLRDGSYFSPQGSTPSQAPSTFNLFD